jgi:hypothetical protein
VADEVMVGEAESAVSLWNEVAGVLADEHERRGALGSEHHGAMLGCRYLHAISRQ